MSNTYHPWSVEKAATALRDNFLSGDKITETTSWIPELIIDEGSKDICRLIIQVLKGHDVDMTDTAEQILMDACTAIAVTHSDQIQQELDIDYPQAEGVIFS